MTSLMRSKQVISDYMHLSANTAPYIYRFLIKAQPAFASNCQLFPEKNPDDKHM